MLTPELKDKIKSQKWRLNNLYTCIDKNSNEVKFQMNPQQEEFFDNHHFCNIILKARQLGFSTFIEIYLLDISLFYPNTACGVIADTLPNAQKLFKIKIRDVYDRLPQSIKAIAKGLNKATESEIHFGNGSHISVGTSHRGGTLNYLHISEFGKICAQDPAKAREIVTGALNTVAPGNYVFIESTAEGASGAFYEMVEQARTLANRGKKLSELQYKFFFFPWWQDPAYRVSTDSVVFEPEDLKYFLKLQNEHGIVLSPEQKAFWKDKYITQKEDMGREYPSYIDEAFDAPIEGSYYGSYLEKLEKRGNVTNVAYDPRYPVETAWDLGMNDATSILFFQRTPNGLRLIDYYEDTGKTLKYYSQVLKTKADPDNEGYVYSQHNMPHDIRNRDLSAEDGDRKKIAESYGIRPINIVQKFDINTGIDKGRTVLQTCWIDEQHCKELLEALRNYRKEYNKKLQRFMDTPRHDKYSHAADAFRYMACSEPPIDAGYEELRQFRHVY